MDTRRAARAWGGVVLTVGLLSVLLAGWPATAQDAPGAEATATRAAEATELAALRTEVAALQTRVAELTTPASIDVPILTAVATMTPISCGPLVDSWGAATAGGVRVNLLRPSDAPPVTATAEAGFAAFALEVTIENRGEATVPYAPDDFRLTTCGGAEYPAIDGGLDPAITEGELAPGDDLQGWITFALPDDDRPAIFTYNIRTPGLIGTRVRCELVDTRTPPAPSNTSISKGCSAFGGSSGGASGGASASGATVRGEDVAEGADECRAGQGGADGRDAVGDDAVGGDAVGGDAVGGDGGDGGDAVGGDAVGGDAGVGCEGG